MLMTLPIIVVNLCVRFVCACACEPVRVVCVCVCARVYLDSPTALLVG